MSENTDKSCIQCGATDEERVLVSIVTKGEDKYVCVRCLPVLIHG